MRNGIYRVWLTGPRGKATGAVVLKDGDLLACSRTCAFTGRYVKRGDRVTADVKCKRLNRRRAPLNMPDLDDFHLKLEGGAGMEFATVTGIIPEAPEFAIELEFAWLCEV